MEKQYIKGLVQKGTDGRITVVVSDATIDRSGESIDPASWDFSNFDKSPRMFVDHDYSVRSLTGIWKNRRVEDGKVKMDPVWHDITELARVNREMVEQGFLDTTSVGFIRKQDENGRIVNELLEVSWVGVPCNPNARVERLSVKDIGDNEAEAIEKFMKETIPSEESVHQNDEIQSEEAQRVDNSDVQKMEEETITAPRETKAGRVLSEKNRGTIKTAIDSMNQSIGVLQELLDATESQDPEGKQAEDGNGSLKQRSSDAGSPEEVFKQWLLMKQVLRAVNTASSDALSKSKLFIRK